MSGDENEEELEKLREEKMEQLKEQQEGDGEAQEAAQQRAEAQKKAVLRQNLTDDARQRLTNVKMSKPQVGEQIEQQIVAIAQSGRVQGKIDDEKMKALLQEMMPDSKSFDIRHR